MLPLLKISIFVFPLFLSGCLMTRNEVSEEKRMQQQVSQLQKNRADQDANLSNYDERLRSLHGRLETVEHQVQVLTQENADLRTKLLSSENRFKELEQAILQVEHSASAKKVEEERPEPANSKDKKRSAYDEAEEFFSQKQWKKAIAFYQKYRDKNPTGPDFGNATLKIGMCFHELKMFKEARVFYEEIIEKYPKSKIAKTAQAKLNQLKKK